MPTPPFIETVLQLALASVFFAVARWLLWDNDMPTATEDSLLTPSAIASCGQCGACVYCWEERPDGSIGKCLACNLLIVVSGERCEYFQLPKKESNSLECLGE